MVLNVNVAIIGCCRCGLLIRPEINIVKTTVLLSASKSVAILTFSGLRIIIVKDVQVSIPRSTDEVVLSFLLFAGASVLETPVDQTSDVLVLLVLLATLSRLSAS